MKVLFVPAINIFGFSNCLFDPSSKCLISYIVLHELFSL